MYRPPHLAPESEFLDHESYLDYLRAESEKVARTAHRTALWIIASFFTFGGLVIGLFVCLSTR